jgi:hypothetical protein
MKLTVSEKVLRETRRCPNGFLCLFTGKCGATGQCEVCCRTENDVLFLRCNGSVNCPYRIRFAERDVCLCPTHSAIHEEYHFEGDLEGEEIHVGECGAPKDHWIAGEVKRLLSATDYAELGGISVLVCNGDVLLRGSVSSYYLKQVAQSRVLGVKGIKALSNEVDVVSASRAPVDAWRRALLSTVKAYAAINAKRAKPVPEKRSETSAAEENLIRDLTDDKIDRLSYEQVIDVIRSVSCDSIPDETMDNVETHDAAVVESVVDAAFHSGRNRETHPRHRPKRTPK